MSACGASISGDLLSRLDADVGLERGVGFGVGDLLLGFNKALLSAGEDEGRSISQVAVVFGISGRMRRGWR